jgi:hypothetical protein
MRNTCCTLLGCLMEKDRLEDLYVDKMIILERKHKLIAYGDVGWIE